MAEDTQKQEESMEDILASIRETVEEEVGKADDDESSASATNSDEDIANELLSEELTGEEDQSASSDDDAKEEAEALAALSNIEESTDAATPAEESSSEDDVLELTDVVEQGDKTAGDDMIDVNKFAESGEITEASKEDVAASRKSYGASADDADDMDVDIDGIMSELESEGEIPSAENNLPSEDDAASFIAQNNVDEDEAQATTQPQGEGVSSADAEQAEQPAAETPAEPQVQAAPATAAATEAVAKAAAEEVAKKVFLPTTPSAKGLQVSFPAEVLAEALRPLVTDWINQNLGDIVERLVKEEISKLVDK